MNLMVATFTLLSIAGGANRWETISTFVNNLCKQDDPRSKDECIEKFNQVVNAPAAADSTEDAETAPTNWTEEQDKLLQAGLAEFPNTMDKNERWASIAEGVPGKTKKECVDRFKAIREALKSK